VTLHSPQADVNRRTTNRRTARAILLVMAASLLTVAPSLAAQPPAESGLARDARTGTPLACLHVALLDSADHAVAHSITDSAGMFVLVAPTAGTYRVGFEIFGWERLVGPLDTLRDGEMRERAYPLEFTRALRSEGDSPGEMITALRRREGAGWRSAVAEVPDAEIRYPRAMLAARTSGSAVAQYIVDERGRVRAESWRPIETSHAEFLAAVRAHVPAMRYQPARLDGRPVCQLVRNQVRFDWGAPVPYVTLFN
jgi:hypothetical protein